MIENAYNQLGLERDALLSKVLETAKLARGPELSVITGIMSIEAVTDNIVQKFTALVDAVRRDRVSVRNLNEWHVFSTDLENVITAESFRGELFVDVLRLSLSDLKCIGQFIDRVSLLELYATQAIVEQTDHFKKFVQPRPAKTLLGKLIQEMKENPEQALELVRLASQQPGFADIIGKAVEQYREPPWNVPG